MRKPPARPDPVTYAESLKSHIEMFFGTATVTRRWDTDYLEQYGLDVATLELPPAKDRNYYVYATCGLGAMFAAAKSPCEYVIASPVKTKEHSELITMLAGVLLGRGRPYGVGEFINIGRPWIHGSKADHLMVSLPYPYGPDLELADIVRPGLRILWLLPVFEAEAEFARSSGIEALEQRFEDAAIDYLDPQRLSVVQG